jgi:very-short-patch-repair endonuclease
MADTETIRLLAWQDDMFGGSPKRTFPWIDMLMQKMKEVGNRPDLEQTDWYKLIVGKTYASIPAMRQAIEAILKARSVEFGLQVMERFFTLDEVPAPDTLPRALRNAREKLVDTGRIEIGSPGPYTPTFQELLDKAENYAGDYNSGVEARFGRALRTRFPKYRWEENKRLALDSSTIIPDFVCEELCLSIEIDSWEFHKDRDRFTSDRKKARAMQFLGYHHLQFSGPELSIRSGIELALMEIERFIERNCR